MHNTVPCGCKLDCEVAHFLPPCQFLEGNKEAKKGSKLVHLHILKVVYDNGEQGVLNLLKECWELTTERKGLKVSFETLGMFLATKFAITLRFFLFYPLHLNANPGIYRSLK